MKEMVANCLMGIARENYRMSACQNLIAKVKADESMDESMKTEMLSFADKVINAELKISQEALEMIKKHGGSANIEAEEEDEEHGGFY